LTKAARKRRRKTSSNDFWSRTKNNREKRTFGK